MGISDYDDLDRLEKIISEYGSIEELTSAIHDIAINESVGFDMDDFIDYLECEKIEKEGNSNCNRCDLCMMQQYLNKAKSGKLPKVAVQNDGKDYPNIN